MKLNNEKEIFMIAEMAGQLYRKFNRIKSKKRLYKELEDLTIIEIDTIIVIGVDEMKSMSQIAASLGVTSGTPTVTVDRLIKKGYVERIRDLDDRRQVFVRLSKDGMRVHALISKLERQMAEEVFGILSTEESVTLLSILSKLTQKMDEVFCDSEE